MTVARFPFGTRTRTHITPTLRQMADRLDPHMRPVVSTTTSAGLMNMTVSEQQLRQGNPSCFGVCRRQRHRPHSAIPGAVSVELVHNSRSSAADLMDRDDTNRHR